MRRHCHHKQLQVNTKTPFRHCREIYSLCKGIARYWQNMVKDLIFMNVTEKRGINQMARGFLHTMWSQFINCTNFKSATVFLIQSLSITINVIK